MKAKVMIGSILAMVVIMAGACSAAMGSTPEPVAVVVEIDDFAGAKNVTRDIEIEKGASLSVTLGSNPTTGYSWGETAEVGEAQLLKQTSTEFVGLESDVVGAPGTQVWTFDAIERGTTSVKMEYSRPWQGGEQGEWTFVLNVTVR